MVQQQSGVRQKPPGRCATGASDKYSAGFRQACVTSDRQESGVRQELSNRCPAPLRQVPGRCPTGVSDRWPTGVRRPTATVKQVSDRHGCPIGLNICPTGVQVPTGVRQACLTSGRQVSGRRLDSDKWPTSVRTPIGLNMVGLSLQEENLIVVADVRQQLSDRCPARADRFPACPDADWSQYGGAIIAKRKSNSSSRCPTATVRQVSGTCPSG